MFTWSPFDPLKEKMIGWMDGLHTPPPQDLLIISGRVTSINVDSAFMAQPRNTWWGWRRVVVSIEPTLPPEVPKVALAWQQFFLGVSSSVLPARSTAARSRDFNDPSPPPTRRPCTTMASTILTMPMPRKGSPTRWLQSIAWLFIFNCGSGTSRRSPILRSPCAPLASSSSCGVCDAFIPTGCYPLFREALGFAPCGHIFVGSDRA